jgi:hypothetical protein
LSPVSRNELLAPQAAHSGIAAVESDGFVTARSEMRPSPRVHDAGSVKVYAPFGSARSRMFTPSTPRRRSRVPAMADSGLPGSGLPRSSAPCSTAGTRRSGPLTRPVDAAFANTRTTVLLLATSFAPV